MTAELVKVIENTYRDINIAFANELALLSEELGVDAHEAIALANQHPRVNILSPGPGVGGHCIPVDPHFLSNANPFVTELIQTARRINERMPHEMCIRDRRYVDYMRAALADVPRYWLASEVVTFERETKLKLSSGQVDILDLVAEGKTYKEIAALRGGSWKTARNLVHALFRKFEVRSKGELVAAAARRGLLDRSAKDSAI